MPSCTDPLCLNENSMFKQLRSALVKCDKETRNILEIRDDTCYVWNPDQCCIFTLKIGETAGKDVHNVPYQTLQPTDPPIFEITNLLINDTATQLALWGNLGIVLIELPRRWGKDNTFQGGKEYISCVNHNLSGCTSQLTSSEIRRVRWHPGSTNDDHLLVLTSENIFQLYECDLNDTPKLIKTWQVGPSSSISPRKMPMIESLGETAVDFDFATPTVRAESLADESHLNWNEIEWPILVLRGDGNVLMVRGNILSHHDPKPVVMGELSIYPPAVDNYGADSCSIMCIPTSPPIVIIATCTGVIYHAILLREIYQDEEDDDVHDRNRKNNENTRSHHGSTYSLHTPEHALFVFESVEMELGLLFNDNDKKYNCPIYLHRNRDNKSRYFCSHNAGIHMITLPVISQLHEFLNSSEENLNLHTPITFNASSSQYLICTRTKHTSKDDATPILGFGILQHSCPFLIGLLHTGIVVDLSITDLDYLRQVDSPQSVTSPSKKITREPFNNYIKNILMHDSTSQPITKLGIKSKLTGKEGFQLLERATTVFRTHHFVKHDRARGEIEKKVRALQTLKNHQLKELEALMITKEELQAKAHDLAERYEDFKEKQEGLAKRAEEVLRLVNCKQISSAERAEAVELRELNDKVQKLAIRLDQLKQKDINQMSHIDNQPKNEKRKELILSDKQGKVIKSTITQMGKDIAMIISRVKTLEDNLDI